MKRRRVGIDTVETPELRGAFEESPARQVRRAFAHDERCDEGTIGGRIFMHQGLEQGRELMDRVRRLQLQLGGERLIRDRFGAGGNALQVSADGIAERR